MESEGNEQSHSLEVLQNRPTPKVFHLNEESIVICDVYTGEIQEIRGDWTRNFFSKAVQTLPGQFYIDGSLQIEKAISHSGILWKEGKFVYAERSSLGRVSVQLATVEDVIYFLAPSECETLVFDSIKVQSIDPMPVVKMYPGAWEFNGNLVVIGGLNSHEVCVYDTYSRSWSTAFSIDAEFVNIGWIQINNQEILIYGNGVPDWYLLDMDEEFLSTTAWLPLPKSTDFMVRRNEPLKHDDSIYCVIGENTTPTVMEFSISEKKWKKVKSLKSAKCCCILQ